MFPGDSGVDQLVEIIKVKFLVLLLYKLFLGSYTLLGSFGSTI